MRQAAFLALIFICVLGRAQADDSGLKACAAIKPSDERLECFDALAAGEGKKALTAAAEAPGAPGVWEISDSKSPVDDSEQVLAQVTSSSPTIDNVGALILRCREHRTELYAATMGFWGFSRQLKVTIRVNAEGAKEDVWNSSDNGKGVFFPRDPVRFVRSLPAAGKIFVRVVDFQGVPHDGSFPLDGIAAARERVGGACKWANQK